MTSRFTIELGDATHAVDYNQLTALLHGYGHVDGFEYELVDGTTLEFDGGEAFVDGSVVEADAKTVEVGEEIDPAGELPRKDVIVVNGNGDLVVETGTENEQIGRGPGRQARMPSPFPLVDLAGTPIAEVWVDSYTTELEGSDITDRRLTSKLDIHTFSAVSAAFDEASVSSAPEDEEDVARKVETDALSDDLGSAVDSLEDGKADDPHALAGGSHESDTLENLNSKISDATLDDEDSGRPPENHAENHHEGGGDELDAADLSGGSGSEGEFLQTDGTSTSWGSAAGVSESNAMDIAHQYVRGDGPISQNPVSVQLDEDESVTVPSGTVWVGTIQIQSSNSLSGEVDINGIEIFSYGGGDGGQNGGCFDIVLAPNDEILTHTATLHIGGIEIPENDVQTGVVSIQLSGESTTVPSNEVWMVNIQSRGDVEINDILVFESQSDGDQTGGNFQTVLQGGDIIYGGGTAITGFVVRDDY